MYDIYQQSLPFFSPGYKILMKKKERRERNAFQYINKDNKYAFSVSIYGNDILLAILFIQSKLL
jgi:hypothetical protein